MNVPKLKLKETADHDSFSMDLTPTGASTGTSSAVVLSAIISSSTDLNPSQDFKGAPKLTKSSNLQASFTIFKSFTGTGILALPYAFQLGGVGLSIFATLFIAYILTHCFLLLLETADDRAKNSKISFQKLARDIIGEKAQYFLQGLIIVEQLGCCIGILIFTRSFLNHVLCSFQIDSLCDNMVFNVLFALLLTVPLSFINNMHYFYIPSLAATFFIVMGFLAQMLYNLEYIDLNPEVKSSFGSRLSTFNFSSLHIFFGIAMFSYEGVGITMSIRDSMEKPQDLPKLLKTQLVGITTVYIIFAGAAALVFGDKLEDIVFFSLPTNDPFYLLIQILYAVSALLSYPIQMFPVIRIIENSSLLRTKIFAETGRAKNKVLRYFVRLCVIGLVFIIAYSAQSFHLFLSFLGSCVFTLLGYIVPVWLYQKQFKGRINVKTRIVNYMIVCITGFFGVLGCYSSLSGLF